MSSSTPVDMWSVTKADRKVASGWLLMPLRLFLGWVLFFAGIQKLANPQFFDTTSPSSIPGQLVRATHSSPIQTLVGHLAPVPTGVGLVIALAEVAIGVCVLVGLWMRLAAVAGFALSLGLFLTANLHLTPYFTGSDIFFFIAWTLLVLAGTAGAPAVDTLLAEQQPARERKAEPDRQGELPRRALLSKGAATGVAAAVVLEAAGLASLFGKLAGDTSISASGPRTLPFASGSANACGSSDSDIPVFNVAAYGALGTLPNTTAPDNTTAIQAAINAAQLVNGIVYFPPLPSGQVYFTSAPLVITTACKLKGGGWHQVYDTPMTDSHANPPNGGTGGGYAYNSGFGDQMSGSVIVSSITSGSIIFFNPVNASQEFVMEDICVVGNGVGTTTTGIQFGISAGITPRVTASNIEAANCPIGVMMATESGDFRQLATRGCLTGIISGQSGAGNFVSTVDLHGCVTGIATLGGETTVWNNISAQGMVGPPNATSNPTLPGSPAPACIWIGSGGDVTHVFEGIYFENNSYGAPVEIAIAAGTGHVFRDLCEGSSTIGGVLDYGGYGCRISNWRNAASNIPVVKTGGGALYIEDLNAYAISGGFAPYVSVSRSDKGMFFGNLSGLWTFGLGISSSPPAVRAGALYTDGTHLYFSNGSGWAKVTGT